MTTRSRISLDHRPDATSAKRPLRRSTPILLLAVCGGIIAGSVQAPNPSKATTLSSVTDSAPSVRNDGAAATPRFAEAARPGAVADDRLVRTLADIVAKRYRVANDATRGLVAIAYQEARRNRLDPLLVLAVIAVESRFNPIAESGGGALGLMQIVPKYHVQTVNETTRANMLDPQHNIGLGARVLKQYVKTGGTEIAGLQLYNGSADDATNAYANRVMAERQGLEDLLRRARDRA